MRGIYRKRFSSTDLKHLWDRDGEEVILEPLVPLLWGDAPSTHCYKVTFSDGHGEVLFGDEVDILPET